MPKFEIEIHRAWLQVGAVTVEADSLIDAKDLAEEIARENSEEVDWDSVDLDPNRRPKAEWGRELQ